MDPLSDILGRVHVSSSLFSRGEFSAPWAVSTQGSTRSIFHVIVRGSGIVTSEGTAVHFTSGDILLFLRGSPHTLRSGDGALPAPITGLPRDHDGGLPCVRVCGGGAQTSILCGDITLAEDLADFLLPMLPSLIHVQGRQTAGWLDQTLRLMIDEVSGDRPGAETVIARLADILLVQILREQMTQPEQGWLSALADPQIGCALTRFHTAAEQHWTAAALAKQAGMSRSAFFSRFTALVGEPPSAYITRWRMCLARDRMRGSRDGLAAVAVSVGYGSEAAFSRAFKRQVGMSPTAWRRSVSA
ncbi:MAG: AraC family transcriptional regulator [Myxococcota bacterium]|nr:AraC family transcriptional regulator [Myxococcota bacterium]